MIYRQGDVLLMAVKAIPKKAQQVAPDERGRVVLAYGEVTGHAHALDSREVVEWTAEGERFIQSALGAMLKHEEHSTIALPAGTYKVIQQKEYSPEGLRNVAD